MSNVSTAHNVTAYDAKTSQPLTGQRLAKARYKSTAKNPAKYPSVCASVPFIDRTDIENHSHKLIDHIRAMLENAQDGILRSLYESSDGNLSSIIDSDISIDACIAYLDAEAQGTRLTKEFLESWFDGALSDYVSALIVEKLGYSDNLTPEQELTVGKHVKGYKDLYSSLSGGKTVLQDKQIVSLLRVLELADSDDTSEKLKARLNAMQNKPKMEELLEL